METLRNNKISETKEQIIQQLFIYRSLNIYQLYFFLNRLEIPSTYPHYSLDQLNRDKIRSLYNQLSQLKKSELVIESSKQPPKQYTLSEEGLSVAFQMNNIPEVEGYRRTGWNAEYGYFPYDLYRPVKERLQKHHQHAIDFNVMLQLICIKYDLEYDYIDNRYSSVEYNNEEKGKKIFRPDGEFIVKVKNSNEKFHFWLELDMGTEKSHLLFDKFEKYKQYLNYVSEGVSHTELKGSIPKSILFVTTSQKHIWARWQNVFRNYMNSIDKWGTYLNLYVCNMEMIEHLILAHIQSAKETNTKLNNNLRPLIQDKSFIGQPKPSNAVRQNTVIASFCNLYEEEEEALQWKPMFTLTQLSNKENQVFLYIKFDRYETNGISKVIDFFGKMKSIPSMKQVNAKDLIPVFYYADEKPKSLIFEGCDQIEKFKSIFKYYLWHNYDTNEWFDMNDHEIDSKIINPLNYFKGNNHR
ncbi:hypothetical protein PTI45_04658 [Paenibacillus nuruki]|uniref:Uncharacterized protein n=1 Tax=Paenibacillus nuruki TaxID=1886670 RepID=A0A1E3KX83_9BACL|nr:replication-relaxation family protein [Paenibacillus nuruki]ODP26003.1 hypothetical protein PTI45_04658 [Paenibacillus nuruki]